ncbi:MAG: hypothetical protein MSA33_09385 [Campylobacter sp.]|uniref:hypothetical protein n=1 Tax=Campylobacter sp. TaxID=205 RepID=UPI002AA6A23A|nr:hypothetical protein [Campylobacter sp.]MCI7550634.1 hypothetical protein [Campylobacter sp.]
MQKPKSLEQIANELAAKREPIKMEPKPKNTGGIDLSRAAGAIKEQPKQQLKQNLAQKSRISSQNLAQKPESKPESKIEPKPEKIVIKPKITTFRDDISALYETPAQNLSKTSLFIAFGIAFLVMIATLPKIFIANEIYYTSRDIGTLRDKLGVLNEENRELKSKLEQIRYQNQIIDNLR